MELYNNSYTWTASTIGYVVKCVHLGKKLHVQIFTEKKLSTSTGICSRYLIYSKPWKTKKLPGGKDQF